MQQNAVRWSNRLKQAAAVCNGLTVINKSTVVGEEFEQSLFKAVEARFKAGSTCSCLSACRASATQFCRTALLSRMWHLILLQHTFACCSANTSARSLLHGATQLYAEQVCSHPLLPCVSAT